MFEGTPRKAIFGLSIAGNKKCRGKKIASAIENFIRLHRRDHHFYTFLVMDTPQKANRAIEIEAISEITPSTLLEYDEQLAEATNILLTNWLEETDKPLLSILDKFKGYKSNTFISQIAQEVPATEKIQKINDILQRLHLKAEISCWDNFLADIDPTKLAESENKYFTTLKENIEFQQAHKTTIIEFANRALKRKYKTTTPVDSISYCKKDLPTYSKDEIQEINQYYERCKQASTYYIDAEMVKLIQAYDNGYRDIYYTGEAFPIFNAACKFIFSATDPMLWYDITYLTNKKVSNSTSKNHPINHLDKTIYNFTKAIKELSQQLPNDDILLLVLINYFIQNGINKICLNVSPEQITIIRAELANEIKQRLKNTSNSRSRENSPQLTASELPDRFPGRKASTPDLASALIRKYTKSHFVNNSESIINFNAKYFESLKERIKAVYFEKLGDKKYNELINKIHAAGNEFITVFSTFKINNIAHCIVAAISCVYANNQRSPSLTTYSNQRGNNKKIRWSKRRKLHQRKFKIKINTQANNFLKKLATVVIVPVPSRMKKILQKMQNNYPSSALADLINPLAQLIPQSKSTDELSASSQPNRSDIRSYSTYYSTAEQQPNNQVELLSQHGALSKRRRSLSSSASSPVITQKRMPSSQTELRFDKNQKQLSVIAEETSTAPSQAETIIPQRPVLN